MEEIRKYLAQAEGWRKRRAEIEKELSIDETDDGISESSYNLEGRDYEDEKGTDNNDDERIIEIEDVDDDNDRVQRSGKIEGEFDPGPNVEEEKVSQSSVSNNNNNETKDVNPKND